MQYNVSDAFRLLETFSDIYIYRYIYNVSDAFRLLETFRDRANCFNDDIQAREGGGWESGGWDVAWVGG
jgi:hypothetical protein